MTVPVGPSRVALQLAALACVLMAGLPAVAATTLKATLISPEPDARLERARLERAFLGHPGGPASDGVQLALEEGQFELQAADVAVALTPQSAGTLEAARAAAQTAEKAGAAVLLTDLPADWTLAVADAVKLPVINLGDASDRLRQQDCRARLFHILPSERMRADALAQTLVARKWSKLLLLVGPSEQDQLRAATAQASIKRYGLKVVASKPFKLSADPRERDLANPLLLTAGSDLRRRLGGRQRRRVRARRCPTAPCCRGRWSATPGWWRWPGTRSSSASARRRCRAASPRPPSGR